MVVFFHTCMKSGMTESTQTPFPSREASNRTAYWCQPCAFDSSTDGVYLQPRSVRKLLNLTWLHAKTKVSTILIKELLFADDTALVSHTEDAFQRFSDGFTDACKQFGIIISLKKKTMEALKTPGPTITINMVKLEDVDEFTFSKSTVSNNLLLRGEFNRGSKYTFMVRLSKRV